MYEEIKKRAEAAKDKKALYGPDIDLAKFQQQTPAARADHLALGPL